MPTETIWVRATVHLPGLKLGAHAQVDPAVPYIAECLAAELLVPLGEA